MKKKQQHIAAFLSGIASGKSTVAHMFVELGAYLIDADIVARQVVEPERGEAWQRLLNVLAGKFC